MDMEIILHLGVSFVISLIFVPIIGRITKKLGIIAHINERTIHKGIISRTGGYAIYAAFLIAAAAFLKTDQQINAILIGFFFSLAVGVIFGWAPARRASRLNPIDALRSE